MNKIGVNCRKLGELSAMPDMADALMDWAYPISLIKIVTTVLDGISSDAQTVINFSGAIQPLGPRVLMLKPDGQRDWLWQQIHAIWGTLNLDTTDKVIYDGVTYKVQKVIPFKNDGYCEYHCVQDFV